MASGYAQATLGLHAPQVKGKAPWKPKIYKPEADNLDELLNKGDSLHRLAVKAKHSSSMFSEYAVIRYDSQAEKCYTEFVRKNKNPFIEIHLTCLVPCWANLGDAYFYNGNYNNAYEYYKKIVDYNKRQGFVVSDSLNYLAEIAPRYKLILDEYRQKYHQLGDKKQEQNFQNEIKAFDAMMEYKDEASSFPGYQYLLNAIKKTEKLVSEDKYNQAIDYSTGIYKMYNDTLGNDFLGRDQLATVIAYAYAQKGDYAKAVEYQKITGNAFSYIPSIEFEEIYLPTDMIRALSTYLYKNGDYEQALAYEKQLVKNEREYIEHAFTDVGTSTRMAYWLQNADDFNRLPQYAFSAHSDSISAMIYDYTALFAKGLLLETDKAILRKLKETNDTSNLKIYQHIVHSKQILAQCIANGDKENSRKISKIISSEEEILSQNVLRQADKPYRLKTTWHDVRKALGDNDIAVEFIDYSTDTDRRYIALTLCKNDTAPVMTKLFYESQLDSLLNEGRPSDALRGNCLYQLAWEPIAQKIKDKKNVYFSPTGILHNIGIEYCPELNNYNLYRLSSTRELVYQHNSAIKKEGSGAVLYGNLNYDMPISDMEEKAKAYIIDKGEAGIVSSTRSADIKRGLRSAGPLPYTKKEVEDISRILTKRHVNNKVMEDNDGMEESFKSLSGHSPSIMHLATHGYYWEHPSEAKKNKYRFLKAADNEYFSDEDVALSRSGLFLAGANNALRGNSLPNDIDDGILTAREIADMDLQGLDLVVLSACQTGLGDIQNGEGVFGLQRGFKKAGAKTILMSLWEIDDQATQILMDKFYDNMMKGMSKQASLKAAQQHLRSKASYADPKYWASFILLDALD